VVDQCGDFWGGSRMRLQFGLQGRLEPGKIQLTCQKLIQR
jgi:hypothetical protein